MLLRSLLLIFLAAWVAGAQTLTEIWMPYVSRESGWYDANKKLDATDSNLCWAASASNVINWWQDNYQSTVAMPEGTPRGDDVWAAYVNSFTNQGGSAYYGIQWWIDGSYPPQGKESWSQITDTSAGGYYTNWDRVAGPEIYIGATGVVGKGNNFVSNVLAAWLSNGYAISLGIGNDHGIAHAVTLWGLDYDETASTVTKLYLTDSDDVAQGFNPQGLFEVDCTYDATDDRMYLQTPDSNWYSAASEIYVTEAIGFAPVAFIPEPGATALMAAAMLFLLMRRRKT